jgi:hypothetical protein
MASLELPHWLMIAGALLGVAGFIGVLVKTERKRTKLIHLPTSRPILRTSRCRLCQGSSTPGQRITPSHRCQCRKKKPAGVNRRAWITSKSLLLHLLFLFCLGHWFCHAVLCD